MTEGSQRNTDGALETDPHQGLKVDSVELDVSQQSPGGVRQQVPFAHLQAAFDRIRSRFDLAPVPVQQQMLHCLDRLALFAESQFSTVFPLRDVQGAFSPAKVTPFVMKMYQMCNDPMCRAAIRWSDDGTRIILLQKALPDVLKLHFSFQSPRTLMKQLNAYGFVSSRSPSTNREELEYRHPFFQRGEEQQLWRVQLRPRTRARRGPAVTPAAATVVAAGDAVPVPTVRIDSADPLGGGVGHQPDLDEDEGLDDEEDEQGGGQGDQGGPVVGLPLVGGKRTADDRAAPAADSALAAALIALGGTREAVLPLGLGLGPPAKDERGSPDKRVKLD